MKRFATFTTRCLSALFIVLITVAYSSVPAVSQGKLTPGIGISPDDGFPVWLTPDNENYIPLVANQTSGLDWVGTTADGTTKWLLAIDDSSAGTIHLLRLQSQDDHFFHGFLPNHLTLPPPEISMLNASPTAGYDFESISLHPWSDTIFLSHEGSQSEIGIYAGQLTYAPSRDSRVIYTKDWTTVSMPDSISNLRRLSLPGWDDAFGGLLSDNLGIEGMACSKDRLYLALESPYSFTDRLLKEKSTILGIWKINPDNPSDMSSCELLAVHDTSDWKTTFGYTIESICGLDALDSNHIVGIDRDWQRLFSAEFSDSGEFLGGRWIFLDAPGPPPLTSDGCDPLDHLPKLVRPSLESVCIVPSFGEQEYRGDQEYYAYLAVDPWAPGWQVIESDWECEGYNRRLVALLPALYRYTLTWDMLFPE